MQQSRISPSKITALSAAGFHLSASVNSREQGMMNGVRSQFNVAVTFDRRKITTCTCTCPSKAYWCAHVVAVCLHRIHMVSRNRPNEPRVP